jgi:cytochrome c-type biogenesis protein CcsB
MLAVVAYTGEYAFGRRGRVARTSAPPQESILVGARVGSSVGSGSSTPAPPQYGVVEVGRPAGERWGIAATALTILAAVLHAAAVILRGVAVDRVPWGNMYEFTLAGTFVVAAFFLVMSRRYALDWLGPVVVTFVLALLMVAVVWLYDPTGPLPEALNSYWLVIHVVSAITATGAFTLGGMTSAAYLLKRRRGDAAVTGVWARMPSLEKLDLISYRIHAFGFPIWTFAVLITGPIWAHQAWSSYWNWDPKEVWAFITWVVYAAYLHARTTAGWRGRNAAILALVGTLTLWFNFIGINYFSSSSQHSYAKAAAPFEQPR